MLEPQSLSEAELFAALEQGASLLTGNLRLSRFLSRRFADHAARGGQAVWLAPEIMPLESWLIRLREDLLIQGRLAPRRLLRPEQELLIWEDIIRHSETGGVLLRHRATARLAQQAWELLHGWRLEREGAEGELNEDAQAFRHWCARFRERCDEQGWTSHAEVPAQLAAALAEMRAEDNPLAAGHLLLAGFEELTPAQQHLFGCLQAAGCEVRWLAPATAETGNAVRVACADERGEVTCMARWLRRLLESRADARVAIVVPDLGARRSAIVETLSAWLPGDGAPLFNVSLGLPLSRYPLVQLALDLLALAVSRRHRLEQPAVSALLLSPFLAGEARELSARARLDAHLREQGEPEISLNSLLYFASQAETGWYCPVLTERLRALAACFEGWARQAWAGYWAEAFAHCLAEAGWTAGRALDSREYQTLEAWQALLHRFAGLEAQAGSLDAVQALSLLRQLAAEQIFQPESEAAPVQVLGLYEVIGLHFDALWLMGMSDQVLPAPARPNPFLPLHLQRRHDLPHASPARELAVAQRLRRRLLAAAPEVIVSHPLRGAGAETLRPASLFRDLPPMQLEPGEEDRWLDRIHRQAGLEVLAGDPAPPIGDGEKIRGGSRIIRLQSNCPFRAFAELRLGAEPLARVDIGLDAMTRGSLIHRVLELIWDTLESQDCLLQLAEAELAALVADMVRVAIRETRPAPGQSVYLELEAERLQGRVLDWLALEKQRPPFRVRETEYLLNTVLEGVPIRMKLDRIDELEDGRCLVIDYKTGRVAPAEWFGERPEDPQLPLYASVVDEELAGLAFAGLRAGALGFSGVSGEEDLLPGVKSCARLKPAREFAYWEDLLANWKATVKRLAGAFRRGEAPVDPLNPGKICGYCELGSLCRIHERDGLQAEEDA